MSTGNIENKPDEVPQEPSAAQEKMKPIEGGRMYSAGDVRLLVIDDDPAIGRLVQATLAGHEFRIEVVNDSQLVEPTLTNETFHVVILDYVLPGLDSTAVLKLVQETQPDASIIVVTAYPTIDSALNACAHVRLHHETISN